MEPAAREEATKTFPADDVSGGVVVRDGFDELDDPYYHRGVTQHGYLGSDDRVAICGFRPPLSGPRSRRRRANRVELASAGSIPSPVLPAGGGPQKAFRGHSAQETGYLTHDGFRIVRRILVPDEMAVLRRFIGVECSHIIETTFAPSAKDER